MEVATAKGRLESLRLHPENPVAREESLAAIQEADWIVMGPGSWFSSVLPHLLVPEQRKALIDSRAKKFLILNLDSASVNGLTFNSGEFSGYTPLEHIQILQKYAPGLRFDYLIADESLDLQGDDMKEHLSSTGGELLTTDLRDSATLMHHSSVKLTSLFAHISSKTLLG